MPTSVSFLFRPRIHRLRCLCRANRRSRRSRRSSLVHSRRPLNRRSTPSAPPRFPHRRPTTHRRLRPCSSLAQPGYLPCRARATFRPLWDGNRSPSAGRPRPRPPPPTHLSLSLAPALHGRLRPRARIARHQRLRRCRSWRRRCRSGTRPLSVTGKGGALARFRALQQAASPGSSCKGRRSGQAVEEEAAVDP